MFCFDWGCFPCLTVPASWLPPIPTSSSFPLLILPVWLMQRLIPSLWTHHSASQELVRMGQKTKTYDLIALYATWYLLTFSSLCSSLLTAEITHLFKHITLNWFVRLNTFRCLSQHHFLLYASLIFISCLVFSSPVISRVFLLPAPAACLCASGLSSVPLCCGGCVKTASRGQDLGVLSATLWLRVKGPARWGLGKRDSKWEAIKYQVQENPLDQE